MEERPQYDRYGWQSDLDTFTRAEPRAVRIRLQEFIRGASLEQVRAWDQCIPWLLHDFLGLDPPDFL